MVNDNMRGNIGLVDMREFSKRRAREKLLWKVRWSRSSKEFLKMEETSKMVEEEDKTPKSEKSHESWREPKKGSF